MQWGREKEVGADRSASPLMPALDWTGSSSYPTRTGQDTQQVEFVPHGPDVTASVILRVWSMQDPVIRWHI